MARVMSLVFLLVSHVHFKKLVCRPIECNGQEPLSCITDNYISLVFTCRVVLSQSQCFLILGRRDSVTAPLSLTLKALAHCMTNNLKIRNIGMTLLADILIIFGG